MKNKNYYCIPFTRKQVIFLLPKCVKRPLKHFLTCYDALKLKLSTIGKFQQELKLPPR